MMSNKNPSLSSQLPFLLACSLVEKPGERISRQLGKVTASSLLRHFFNGNIVFWKNFPELLYPVSRVGLHEMEFPLDSIIYKNYQRDIHFSQMRYEMAGSLTQHCENHSWLIFADPGVIALRNWDHLFENQESEILISPNLDGKPGDSFFAVRGSVYHQFLHHWSAIHQDGQLEPNLLQSILMAGSFQFSNFEQGEVAKPFQGAVILKDVLQAAAIDPTGGTPEQKAKLGFALHMMGTFGDEDGVFLDLIES